jgi:hypothetical protein
VDVGGDEARAVPHHLLGGLDEQVDEWLLVVAGHGENVDQGGDVLVALRGYHPGLLGVALRQLLHSTSNCS